MARCPRCGSEAIEEINYNTYKCHECGYMIRNPDDRVWLLILISY